MVDIYKDAAAGGFPVYQQGAAPATKDLPVSFVTLWNDNSEDILHADNKSVQCRYDWTLTFYTKDVNKIFNGLQSVIDALKLRGYLINGRGYDVAGSWEGYAARAVDVIKIENLEV